MLSQIQLIQSRDIARTMIQRFDLGQKSEFDDLLGGMDPVTRVAVMLGFISNPAAMSQEERVLEKYFDKLKAFAVARSRVVAIEFQSKDAALAAKMADAIAEEYIRHLEAAKKGSARAAGSWLGRTIESLRERVAAAEAKVETYRTQNGLFMVGGGADGGNISAQQLSELNTQLATARSQQAELTAKARNIREAIRQGRIFEVSEVVNNEVVRRLIEQRATLKALIAQEERTLLPQHPRIKELRAQLGGLEEQVRAAAERAARVLENDSRAAGARVVASQAELDQQKRVSGTANEQEVMLRALEREAKAEREQLETYLARYRDASVRDADNAVTADARIVSRAILPTNPSFPKRLPIIIIATLAGFVVSLFWILTRALLTDSVYARRRDAIESASVTAHWAPPAAAAAMVASPVAAYQPAPPSVASMPASGSEADLSQATLTMLHSLDRVAEAMAARSQPIIAPLPEPLEAAPRAPAFMAARSEGVDLDRTRVVPSFLKTARATEAAPVDPEHVLHEIADEAEAAMIRGRPVSVLVLSVESQNQGAATAALLERIFMERGLATATVREKPVTAVELSALIRGAGPHMDCLIFNGGVASPNAGAMSRIATLTILVASDEPGSLGVDEAGRLLAGCDYFIVDAEREALETA